MAIRRLHGSVNNTGTLRVMAALFEHQVEFEFVCVDLKAGQNMTHSFLSLSPFGDIPVLQDGDLTLFESRAAMRYISHEYATQAIEQVYLTPLLQGAATTWIDVETHHFQPPALRLISELIDKPRSGQVTDEAAVAKEEERLGHVLDVYEERLAKYDFLGGDKFTSADLTHSSYVHLLMATRVKRVFESRARVGAWSAMLLSRPAWAKVVHMVTERGNV